jgi:hypothetical protein
VSNNLFPTNGTNPFDLTAQKSNEIVQSKEIAMSKLRASIMQRKQEEGRKELPKNDSFCL